MQVVSEVFLHVVFKTGEVHNLFPKKLISFPVNCRHSCLVKNLHALSFSASIMQAPFVCCCDKAKHSNSVVMLERKSNGRFWFPDKYSQFFSVVNLTLLPKTQQPFLHS